MLIGALNRLGFWTVGSRTIHSRKLFRSRGVLINKSGWGGYVLKEKIKRLKQRLKQWNREQFGDTFKKFKKIEEELNKLETQVIDT